MVLLGRNAVSLGTCFVRIYILHSAGDSTATLDHTMSQLRLGVGSSLAPHAALLMPPSSPTVSVLAFHGLTGSAKCHTCKRRVAILSLYLSVATIYY